MLFGVFIYFSSLLPFESMLPLFSCASHHSLISSTLLHHSKSMTLKSNLTARAHHWTHTKCRHLHMHKLSRLQQPKSLHISPQSRPSRLTNQTYARMTHHFSTNRISAHRRPSSVSRTARQWLCFRRTTQPHRRWRKCMHPLPSCSEKCSAHRTSPRPRPRSILIGCAVLCEIRCADMRLCGGRLLRAVGHRWMR